MTIQSRRLLSRLHHRRLQLAGIDAAVINGLVDVELALYTHDAILARLGQIKTGATGGPKLGDHVLVVGQGDLYINSGFFLELGDHLIRGVATPGNQAKFFRQQVAGSCGCGQQGGQC